MSVQQPTPYHTHPPYQPPPSNALGLTGFVLSLGGLIVCAGALCPVGLIVSLLGLRKEPRGFAIAGAVIGAAGTILAAGLGYGIYRMVQSGTGFWNMFPHQSMTSQTMFSASFDIDNYHTQHNALPDEATGSALVGAYMDEWNTPLKYKPTQGSSTDYEMISAGPDQQFATGDDYIEYFSVFGSGSSMMMHNAPAQQAPDPTQLDFTFNQAAMTIANAYPPGTSLPDEAAGNSLIANQRDAWGRPMKYSPTDNPPMYHLKSAGEDGVWENEDDIVRSFYFDPTGDP